MGQYYTPLIKRNKMLEDSNNPRLWLVTGVRYRDVKDCFQKYLAELKAGTVMQVSAALRENGAFKNLGVYTEWRGNILNVGVISAKMRDEAATYMDDEGEMEVRVVEGTISDKDFWVEPVDNEPKRPMPQPFVLPDLPFDPNLVPLRTDAEMKRSTATRLLKNAIKFYADNYKLWSFSEKNSQTQKLVKKLQDYPQYCLHSLCKEEHNTLLDIIGQLKKLTDNMTVAQNEINGLKDFVFQLNNELETIKDVEREYSKKEVCGQIYLKEMNEMEKYIRTPEGMLPTYFKQLGIEKNEESLSVETYSSELAKINHWFEQFMTTWYIRAKDDTEKLAHIIETEHLSRVELNGYYCCEILAKDLKQRIKGKNNVNDMMVQPAENAGVPSLSSLTNKESDPTDDGIDPDHIISVKFDKQMVIKSISESQQIIDKTQRRYAYLMKVMIDHKVINIQESDQLKFAKFIISYLKDEKVNLGHFKETICKGIARLKSINNIPSDQVLPYYWVWEKESKEKKLCMEIGEIFEKNGFSMPRISD